MNTETRNLLERICDGETITDGAEIAATWALILSGHLMHAGYAKIGEAHYTKHRLSLKGYLAIGRLP